jgi:hypothetical protein
MKTCSGPCGATLPLDDFYRDRRCPDGHRARCKRCHLASIYAERARNPERYRSYMREYMRETRGLRGAP